MAEAIGDYSKEIEKYTGIYIKKPIGLDIKELIKIQKIEGTIDETKMTTDYDE
jgi:hypothetical protein